MVGRLKRMLSQESYDGIYAICSQMAPYLTLAKATDENAKAILEDTELTFVTKYREFVLKKGLLRILASQEHQRAKDYAAKVWPRFDRIIVMSDLDKEKLLSLNRGMSILVVPNGVDTEYFRAAAPPRPDRKILGFLGGALHYPNVDALAYFCHDILPLVHRDMPDTSLLVIGDFFDRQACPSNTPVRYTGYVEDVRPHLADCTLFVAPIRIGGGTRLKILEAMSLGIPVVSTPIGCEGLDVEHGRDILIADTAEKFASSIKAVLSDETFRRSLSGNGRRLVEQKYAWRLVLKRLARFFQDEPTPGS
jgi:glycosyltransferase involved in cell wall biosynthesis